MRGRAWERGLSGHLSCDRGLPTPRWPGTAPTSAVSEFFLISGLCHTGLMVIGGFIFTIGFLLARKGWNNPPKPHPHRISGEIVQPRPVRLWFGSLALLIGLWVFFLSVF